MKEEEEERVVYQVAAPLETVMRPKRCEHGTVDVRDPQCRYQGVVIPLGHHVRDNCNNCTCEVSMYVPPIFIQSVSRGEVSSTF